MIPRYFRKLIAAGAVVICLADGPIARADQYLDLGFDTSSGAPTISLSLTGQATSNNKVTMNGVEPGPYFFNVVSASSGVTYTSPISTFCIQLTTGLTSTSSQYTIVTNIAASSTSIGANNASNPTGVANAIQYLFGANYNSAWANVATAQTLASSNSVAQTAFQLALWELTYDGAYDISLATNASTNFFNGSLTGQPDTLTVTGDPSAVSLANSEILSDLAAIIGNPNAGINELGIYDPGETLVALTSPSYQDQLWLEPTPKVVVMTPAPPGLLLAGIGFLALVGRSRFGRRTPVATPTAAPVA